MDYPSTILKFFSFCSNLVLLCSSCFPFSLIFSPNDQKSLLFKMAFIFFRFKKKWVFPLKLIMPRNLALINSHCKNKHTKLFWNCSFSQKKHPQNILMMMYRKKRQQYATLPGFFVFADQFYKGFYF